MRSITVLFSKAIYVDFMRSGFEREDLFLLRLLLQIRLMEARWLHCPLLVCKSGSL